MQPLLDLTWAEELGSLPPIPFPPTVNDAGKREKRNARRRELYHQTRSKKVRKAIEEANKNQMLAEVAKLKAQLKKYAKGDLSTKKVSFKKKR